jgi:glycosyltransferase involved in cell wall biosynthesis
MTAAPPSGNEAPSPAPVLASVVISCKNRTEMLRDCMRGLAEQTIGLDRFEVVLIDNCSTEDLGVVAAEARAMGLTLRMARTERDGGPAPARNIGVSMASAPIIAFTDSDCRATPDWLAAALPHFDDPRLGLLGGPVLPKPGQEIALTTKQSFVSAAENPTWPTANLFMRRDVFLAHGGFDPSLSFFDLFDRATECADTDLAWRVIKSGWGKAFEPRAVIHHELERQTLWQWIIEPSRLIVLPELVRRHPELRRDLLVGGYVFYPVSKLLYVAVPAAALFLWHAPWLLLLLPVALVLRGIQRTGGVNPAALARHALRVLANLPRLAVLNLTLLYGSIRFRSLVI